MSKLKKTRKISFYLSVKLGKEASRKSLIGLLRIYGAFKENYVSFQWKFLQLICDIKKLNTPDVLQ